MFLICWFRIRFKVSSDFEKKISLVCLQDYTTVVNRLHTTLSSLNIVQGGCLFYWGKTVIQFGHMLHMIFTVGNAFNALLIVNWGEKYQEKVFSRVYIVNIINIVLLSTHDFYLLRFIAVSFYWNYTNNLDRLESCRIDLITTKS